MPSDQELAGFGPRMINSSTGLGRVSLITGAASPNGFGRRTAQLLAKHGARVVVTDVPTMESMGKELVDEIKKEGGQAIWCTLDVSNEQHWKDAIALTERTYGPLDVLVNNAGIFTEYKDYLMNPKGSSLSQHPTADWDRMVAINQTGVYFGIKYGSGSMEKNTVKESKSIVNFSSLAAFMGGSPLTYSATKWAVRGLTKHVALFLAPKGIRCNSVHPGTFPTDILKDSLDPSHNPQLTSERVERNKITWSNFHPMSRMGSQNEVANLVLYLASSESSFTWVFFDRDDTGHVKGDDLFMEWRLTIWPFAKTHRTGAEHVIDGGMGTTVGYNVRNPFPATRL